MVNNKKIIDILDKYNKEREDLVKEMTERNKDIIIKELTNLEILLQEELKEANQE